MSDPAESPIFTDDDDDHHGHLAGDEWWFTETAWFSWHHAERGLGGWLYTMIRHNIGTVAGGAWVWDDSALLPWEVLYSSNLTALPFDLACDLRDCELPNGVSMRVEAPRRSYRLGYDDPGRLELDLSFEAVTDPRPLVASGSTFGRAAHFDQIGRVRGEVAVAGERLEIDCWSMRDRTWGRRPEDRPRQAAYVTAAADGGRGFLAVTNTREGQDRIAYGFVQREDQQVALVDGSRSVRRNPAEGFVDSIEIDGMDGEGGRFRARGTSVSRIFINRHSFIDINSLIRWELLDERGIETGDVWWGEDQDMWPVHRWSAARRSLDWSLPT